MHEHDSASRTATGIATRRWFHGWNVLAVALMAAAAAIGVVVVSFTFWVASWMEEFGVSRAHAMLALSALQVVAGFVLPIAGYAMDRYSIRWIAIGGVLCLAAGFTLVSVASSMWQIILIYALVLSTAEAIAGPILAQTLAAKWFRARRGVALGVASIGPPLGGFVCPPLIAFLLSQYGWRQAFLLLAIFSVVLLVPALFLVVRNSPEQMGIDPEPESPNVPQRPATSSTWTARRILKERAFWFIVLGFLPLLEMTTAFMSNLAPYTADLGIEAQGAAYLMSLFSLAMIMGQIGFGALADQVDHRLLYYAGVGLLVIALLLLTTQPSYTMMVGIIVVLGIAAGGQVPLVGAMIGHHFGPAAFGSVIGLFYLCMRPVAFSAPIAGWLRDYSGTYTAFWMLGLVIVLLFCPLMYFLPRRSEAQAH